MKKLIAILLIIVCMFSSLGNVQTVYATGVCDNHDANGHVYEGLNHGGTSDKTVLFTDLNTESSRVYFYQNLNDNNNDELCLLIKEEDGTIIADLYEQYGGINKTDKY